MSKLVKGSTYSLLLMLVLSLALAACGGGSGSGGGQTVNVTLSEMKVQSSLTTFSPGVVYHFAVSNKGTMPHEFLIMAPTTDQASVAAQRQLALVSIASSDLQPGTTKTVDYTFTKAYPDGSLEMACHLPGHYEAGMHTSIAVK